MFGTHAATSMEVEAERRREVLAATMRAGGRPAVEHGRRVGLAVRGLTPMIATLVALLGGSRPH